ncbi:hypothetical protein RHECNPAF_730062 [Rhizobium etli CNPAF512]|nr:hypothetical protein RHECNPAF_730062 [Rhizobium etli CNPAF512]
MCAGRCGSENSAKRLDSVFCAAPGRLFGESGAAQVTN